MIRRVYQVLTGRPWTTTRSCAAEFGPPPGALYAAELAAYTDVELIRHGHRILAEVATRRPATATPPPAPAPAVASLAGTGRRP